jgi:hypothetical protein
MGIYKAKNFFFEDIAKISEEIYNNILRKKEAGQLKIETSRLSHCIEQGSKFFLDIYSREMVYNVGNMGFSGIEEQTNKLKEVLKRECERQAERLSTVYRNYCKEKRSNKWTLWFSGIAAFTASLPYFTKIIKHILVISKIHL